MRRFSDRWCYLGGGSTTQTTKNETDPQLKALMLNNYATAQGVADTPFQAYTGQRVAATNPTQMQGQAGLLAAANDPTGTGTLNRAVDSIGGLLSYRPQTTDVSPVGVNAGQLSNTDLAPYMNPFTKNVIDQTISQQQHSRDMQGVTDNASATAANAFGGTRQAVQRALTTEGYDRNTGSLIAGLNSDNFNQARGAASTDIANRLGADQFNSTARLGADQFNATTRQGADRKCPSGTEQSAASGRIDPRGRHIRRGRSAAFPAAGCERRGI